MLARTRSMLYFVILCLLLAGSLQASFGVSGRAFESGAGRPADALVPIATPRPTATPTLEPTLLSDPILPMQAPLTNLLDEPEGLLTFAIPEGWFWMDIAVGVVVASDNAAGLTLMVGAALSDNQIGGIVFFEPQDRLPNYGLSRNASAVEFLTMAFRSFKSQGESKRIAEVEPIVEQFVVSDKHGAATVFHCPACGQDENYLVVVEAEGGIAWTVFQLRTLTVDEYRDTLRAIMASVEFTAMEDAAPADIPPYVVVSAASVNLRTGPGTDFARLASAAQGDTFLVLGKTADGAWYLIRLPAGQQAWITAQYVTLSPEGAEVPVATAAP